MPLIASTASNFLWHTCPCPCPYNMSKRRATEASLCAGVFRAVPTVTLAPIEGSVIILPQIVPALRNNGIRRPLTGAHRDPYDWDLPKVRQLLSAFFAVTRTTSLPPLEEYTTLPEKVRPFFLLHSMGSFQGLVAFSNVCTMHSDCGCVLASWLCWTYLAVD
jgi:hypothetical protein